MIYLGHLILHIVPMTIFGYCLFEGYNLTQKLYGGKFTSVMPPLLGAIALLFFSQLIDLVFEFTPVASTDAFIFSIQAFQLFSGLLFIDAIYKVYQIGFATSGFVRVRRD